MNPSIIETALKDSEVSLSFKAGETLFREGEQPRGVQILQSGEVDLLFSARNGNAKPLRHVHPGQILGLSCVVTQRPNDCTAVARTACNVGFVDREQFLKILDECPAVWFSVLKLLSNDVNAAYDDMRALVAR